MVLAGACIDRGPAPGSQPAAGTFAIGFLGNLTGSDESAGRAAELAVSEADASAPEGVAYVLRALDTRGNPAQAAELAVSLAGDESVVGLVLAAEVAPHVGRVDLATVSPRAPVVAPAMPVRYPGSAAPTPTAAVASYVSGELQAGRVALLAAGDPQTLRAALVAAGVEVAAEVGLDPAAESFPEAVAAARALEPAADVVVYQGPAQAGGRLARDLTEGGVRSLFVGGETILDGAFVPAAGTAAAAGARAVCACVAPTAGFREAYRSLAGEDPRPYDAEAYAVTRLLLDGLVAGHTGRAELREYLDEQDAVDVLGDPVPLGEGGEQVPQSAYVVRGGRWEPVNR